MLYTELTTRKICEAGLSSLHFDKNTFIPHDLEVRYPLTIIFSAISLFLFAVVNHFGDLPEWAFAHFGFSPAAPYWQWIYRTITSDWLYSGAFHFWSCVPAMALVLLWAEKTHDQKVLLKFVLFVSFFDDFINYFLIKIPFHFIQPALFHVLVREKDVGGSLILASLLGLQLCQLRRSREVIFVVISVLTVLATVFSSTHYTAFVLNINHYIFLSIGYIVGKIEFEYLRARRQVGMHRRLDDA
jgi:hypothetical protein